MATIPQFQNPRPFGTNSTNLAAPSLNSFQRLGNPYSSMSTSASSVSSNGPQLPGAWFYEIGPVDDTGSGAASTGVPGDCSPIADFGDERKHTIESVEVPSSEHVAEIVGRQGKSLTNLYRISCLGSDGFSPFRININISFNLMSHILILMFLLFVAILIECFECKEQFAEKTRMFGRGYCATGRLSHRNCLVVESSAKNKSKEASISSSSFAQRCTYVKNRAALLYFSLK